MKFYDYRSAPSPRKVRLFIAEKGLDLPVVEVDLRARAQQEPAFLAKNPGATVPVLELDDGACPRKASRSVITSSSKSRSRISWAEAHASRRRCSCGTTS